MSLFALQPLAPCDGEHFASNSLEENQYVGDAWGPAAPRAPCDVGIPIADGGQQLEAHPLDTQVRLQTMTASFIWQCMGLCCCKGPAC